VRRNGARTGPVRAALVAAQCAPREAREHVRWRLRAAPSAPCFAVSRLLQAAAVANTFQNLNGFFRTVVLLALVVIAGGWRVVLRSKLAASERALEERTLEPGQTRDELGRSQAQIRELGTRLEERAAEVARLKEVVAEQERELQALELANRLLKVSHRV